MKNKIHTYLSLLFLLILISCGGLKNNSNSENNNLEIISQKIQSIDSLNIQIVYKELNGCIDLRIGRINIKTNDEKFVFSHIPTEEKANFEYFYGKNNGLIDFIIDFEKKGKDSKLICGGISGGTMYEVNLKINDEKTKFGFCRVEFDGINKLINQIETLKQKN